MQTEWSLTEGGRLQELNHRESLPRRGPDTSTLWKIISLGATSKLGCNMVHTAKIEIRKCVKWSLTRG